MDIVSDDFMNFRQKYWGFDVCAYIQDMIEVVR